MIEEEIIIVGGGPAGSGCAWRLKQSRLSPLILDKAAFPREKLSGTKPEGYSYYLRSKRPATRLKNAFVIGDASGLATLEFCEVIGPAVRGGLLMADAIAGRSEYSLDPISRHSAANGLYRRALGYMFATRRCVEHQRWRCSDTHRDRIEVFVQ